MMTAIAVISSTRVRMPRFSPCWRVMEMGGMRRRIRRLVHITGQIYTLRRKSSAGGVDWKDRAPASAAV